MRLQYSGMGPSSWHHQALPGCCSVGAGLHAAAGPVSKLLWAHQAKRQTAATVARGATSKQVCDTLLATNSAGGSEAAERAPPAAAMGAEGGQTQVGDGKLRSRLFLFSCCLSAWLTQRQGPLPEHASCACHASDKGQRPFTLSACSSSTAAQAAACIPALMCPFHHITLQDPSVLHGPCSSNCRCPSQEADYAQEGRPG